MESRRYCAVCHLFVKSARHLLRWLVQLYSTSVSARAAAAVQVDLAVEETVVGAWLADVPL